MAAWCGFRTLPSMARLFPRSASVRILIAGGGVAALEGALALRALVDDRPTIELLGAEPHFWYRPLAVAEPFSLGEARHFELAELAAAIGATFTLGTLQGVDATERNARTSVGDIPYDMLLVAVGAVPTIAVPGALTFRGPADTDKVRELLQDLADGLVRRVVFAVPPGAVWSLPLYELALMTATHLDAQRIRGVELALVTPEEAPLQLFGVRRASRCKGCSRSGTSRSSQVETRSGSSEASCSSRMARFDADRVVTLPRLRGTRIDGLPQTVDGFIPVDTHGRVSGIGDVYGAGDITTFPLKQGGIAAQQADAAAQMIASQLARRAAATVQARAARDAPHRPASALPPPRADRRSRPPDELSLEPFWWPPAKIVGRHVGPFLARLVGCRPSTEPMSRRRRPDRCRARPRRSTGVRVVSSLRGKTVTPSPTR